MLRFLSRKSLALAAMAAGLSGGSVASAASPVDALKPAPLAQWTPRYITLKHTPVNQALIRQQANANTTIPYWTNNITSPTDHLTYTVSMVGSSPYALPLVNTNVTYVPIVARIHFPGGIVLDPTLPASCDTGQSVATRFFSSPLFVPAAISSNGVNIGFGIPVTGKAQLTNAFQRANFWRLIKGSPYGVNLTPSQGTPIVVDVTAPVGSSAMSVTNSCGKIVALGLIDINAYDSLVTNLTAQYATPTQLPLVLSYNVVEFDTTVNNCCILGYHNAIPVTGGAQTYAIGAYMDAGIFSATADIGVWAHEIAEWMDDPFVQASVPGGGNDDLTPSWGNVGQVSGCQNNLEVGDPLSGTQFSITGQGGFVYHYQDEAFMDWFYRTPSSGSASRYSFQGRFTRASLQRLC